MVQSSVLQATVRRLILVQYLLTTKFIHPQRPIVNVITAQVQLLKVLFCQAPDCAKRWAPLYYFKGYSLTYHLAAIHLEHLKAVNSYIHSQACTFAAGLIFSNSVSCSPKLLVPAIH